MEQKKNEFLVALYEKNFQTAEKTYIDIVNYAELSSRFDETTEKLLNQIQTIFKKFTPDLMQGCTSKIKKYNTRLNRLVFAAVKHASGHVCHVEFLTWEKTLGLDPRQKALVYKTAMTFQLTSGCSNYCRRCNEWALPKVRSHFSYQAALKILEQMSLQKNDEISLYGASDPLDWEEDGKTIFDILLYLKNLPIEYSLLTKVPKGKDILLKTLLKIDANLSVSITSKNKARINKIQQELELFISRQHDLEELLIPAGLDEDFVTLKPSITDGYGVEITPEGAFIIVPTFTSALHPFGHKKIKITSATNFFPLKKTGRNALLVDYFKPLEGYDLNQNLCHLTWLFDVQIESILLDTGTDELTPPGMRGIKEYLSIFEETARCQRKKMTLSVLKHLKNQVLLHTDFKNLSEKNQAAYLKKIVGHLNLCKKEGCCQAKLYTVSFFLESIYHYQLKNPGKIKIIRFLLKDEMESSFLSLENQIAGRSPEVVFKDSAMDAFNLFRYYICCLLTRSENAGILSFINAFPSAYDPDADIFVHK
ncbi:MAG: hypothetical protein KKE44_17160 [Proteobacteria bacterium]|nr:hypothetical protein [Pseudomonadota bacterium]MBU1584460.1 hypothetical protein [Pseudomonadota bacterium]MBU2452963.1 hypothetical protein [Pseudomonadota bacterium]